MRKELYEKRTSEHLCVCCTVKLDEGCTRRKCDKCLKKARDYKKKTRDAKRAEQERKYRSSVWFKRCLYRAKQTDEDKDRTEEGPYMSPERLQTLRILQLNKCFYCEKKLQTENRRAPDGLTIERLSNKRPHTLGNCVLCCHQCNVRRISNHHDIGIHDAYYEIIKKFEKDPVVYQRFLKLMEEVSIE